MYRWLLAATFLIAVSALFSCNTASPPPQTVTNTSSTVSTTSTTIITTSTSSTTVTTPTSTTGAPGKVTLEQLVEMADYILVGSVVTIEDSHQIEGRVYTLVTFNVEQQIKGNTIDEVTIKVPGGVIGGIGSISTDTPTFHYGEKAVVFLVTDGNYFTVAGGFYGKVTIDENNMAGGMPLSGYIDQIKDILATP